MQRNHTNPTPPAGNPSSIDIATLVWKFEQLSPDDQEVVLLIITAAADKDLPRLRSIAETLPAEWKPIIYECFIQEVQP
ncbi:hypothetical protein VSS37_13415 [Candidatus Thiothrix sp. Deng01]|uniref:Uncharacterized protein n=1 Tax=Candidatus Thiothrix phosphatis TaxID=3112415 RepID=A0ABU6CYS4_9GAMM|nr:hypothetical protein [Candidatus Thiothrix sp. Deng01]MEB4591986.1 hypothetical protein [Candidatus Thiothrix sp. Deng01]